jgi:cell wall-associated NlpC family hydrolase
MASSPHDLDRKHVDELLRELRSIRDVPTRMERISRHWLGRPFHENPLGGAPGQPEAFRVSLDGFDCVTFIESVLALAMSTSVAGFVDNLRLIRYRRGEVNWQTRNHYMSAWIRENSAAGFVSNRTRGPRRVRRERRLNIVPGLAERTVSVDSIPKSDFNRHSRDARTGDLIFFASTRRNLDIFHCGIIVRDGERVLMRHAARSRGRVVEQELQEFLHANRMTGVILVRPREAFPQAA